jgi:signal transduction histidine kinase
VSRRARAKKPKAPHEDALSGAGSVGRYLDHAPTAVAVTRGAAHTLVYANAAFRRLLATSGEEVIGRSLLDALALTGRDTAELPVLLDRAYRQGAVMRDHLLGFVLPGMSPLSYDVWPVKDSEGRPDQLVVEVRDATNAELTLALQRDVAERLVLSALRAEDLAEDAQSSRHRAGFLAEASRRLSASLDEANIVDTLSTLALPDLGAWCIVDIIESGDVMRRLAIVHPDPAKQALVRELEGRWTPQPGDPFGAAAALRSAEPAVATGDLDTILAARARDPDTLRILRQLGVGSMLTVPLVAKGIRLGAVTFVSGQSGRTYSPQDVEVAEELVRRGAMALENARLFGEALTLRVKAEAANLARATFLSHMTHEIRTPLNAIGGYIELIEMGVRGPVSDELRSDLGRIRSNQRYLLALITDLLTFARVGGGRVRYNQDDVVAHDVIVAAVNMVEPLIVQKKLAFDGVACDLDLIVHVDAERIQQILLNLLTNALKFTPAGGRIAVECDGTDDTVRVTVADTGIGIPEEKLGSIFEPFFQIKGGLTIEGGIGLGLAISRDLARAMQCDLTVESTFGKGSRFTLTMPRGRDVKPPTQSVPPLRTG